MRKKIIIEARLMEFNKYLFAIFSVGEKTPKGWKVSSINYRTDREGMRNTGHDENIFFRMARSY